MAHNPNELVWAKKPGFPRKQFTRRQLESMGSDEGQDTFDGWEIVPEVEEPQEVKAAKLQAAAEAKEKAEKAKADKEAAKIAAEKAKADKKASEKAAKEQAKVKPAEAPVVPLNPDQGSSDNSTKKDADNGQTPNDPQAGAKAGDENPDLGGSAAAPSGEGN